MKKAIVVGATSGIGRQLALDLADKNYMVGVTGRRKNRLEELQSERSENIRISSFDVTNTAEVPAKLEALADGLGGLDLLVLSSGVGDFNPELKFDIEKDTIDVNVSGFTAVADWAFRYFERQKGGHFAAITSLAGFRGSRHAPAYYATKAYQINYLEGLGQRAKKAGIPIYVTDIRPGFVDTEMAKDPGEFWVAPVEKASRQIVAALEKKKSVVYVSRRWRSIAAVLKVVPRQVYKYL